MDLLAPRRIETVDVHVLPDALDLGFSCEAAAAVLQIAGAAFAVPVMPMSV
jgi:hypothetical protein